MKNLVRVGVVLIAVVAVAGCGVTKGFVKKEIESSEARATARMDAIDAQTQLNAAEISRLNALAVELDKRVGIAVNKVKGFENFVVIWSGEVNFGYDSFELTATAQQILQEAGDQMLLHPGSLMEISGHTDASGTKSYNMILGDRRANAAKTYIVEHSGVHLYRLFLVSFGEDKPATMSDTRNADSRNRRVTLKLWGEPSMAQNDEAPTQ